MTEPKKPVAKKAVAKKTTAPAKKAVKKAVAPVKKATTTSRVEDNLAEALTDTVVAVPSNAFARMKKWLGY